MTPIEIRSARLALGLTQKQFGKMLHASLKAVQAWEYGKRNMQPATEELLKIKMKEKAAQMADYESEADMEDRIDAKSEIVAKEID